MHLRSRLLPRPSVSSPLDNSQALDLEGLHREMHGIAEQIRIMNENNARLIQHLTTNNPPPLPAAPVPEIERSRRSQQSGDDESQSHRKSRSSSRTPEVKGREVRRRGRSSRRDDQAPRRRDKSNTQKFRDLDTRIDAINTGTSVLVTVDALIRQNEPPFIERVMRTRVSSRFKLPTHLGVYEGKTDLMDHLDSYKKLMLLQGYSDEVMCKAFSATLKGLARSWFRKLSPGTIDSFSDLSKLFVVNFMSCRTRQKNASYLFTIHQKEAKSLKDYVKWFNQAILEVEDPSDKVVIMAMMEGLRSGPLFDSLSQNVPETLSTLQSNADKYIAAEELAEAKRRRRGKGDHKRKELDSRRIDYRDEARNRRPDRDQGRRINDRRPRTPPRRPEVDIAPSTLPSPRCSRRSSMRNSSSGLKKSILIPEKRNKNKYYSRPFQEGVSLRKYVADRPPLGSPERRYGDNKPTAGDIQVIYGGFGPGGLGAHIPITFTDDDLRGLHLPHDNALIISSVIANFNVQRILVDNGSLADILFISTFDKIKIGLNKLHPFHTPRVRFVENTTHPLGWIKLPVTLGTEPLQTTIWQDFIVVDFPSPYNAILGRPTLGGTKAITSTYHREDDIPHFN
ncbi:hypothetical protein Acr_14g0007510 [Actinidia rufa]|uniref:Retrotransposon gag domain-containing protein n=1 Tax=Actinidia rufa TaxID=165716 RepID=A0A7J0FQX1_9ERIC|nr:hypothetical protein Acr_14g0007510 [Actinidia rufa]